MLRKIQTLILQISQEHGLKRANGIVVKVKSSEGMADQPDQSDSTPINWEERAEGEPEGGGKPEQAVSEDQGEVPIDVDEPFEAVNNFGVYRTADEQEDDSPSESGGDVQVGEGQEGGHGCPGKT